MSVDDQIAVQKVVKNSGTSFFWGMNVLNKDKKRAMFSIYAFCRIVDDIADDLTNKKIKQIKLKAWKRRIRELYRFKVGKTSIERELLLSIEKFQLEKQDFNSIINGMMMDAKENIKFPSRKYLHLYCDRVAVAVGYLSIKIFGLSEKERKYAFYLGRAFQLTNIVRDFYEDMIKGRCYIPKDLLSKYKMKKKLKTIIDEQNLQSIFQDILSEANNYYERSLIESKKISKKKIIASEIMKVFYKALHSKMYKKKINIRSRVKLNYIEKIFFLFNFFARY